jgi:hypothetical protein
VNTADLLAIHPADLQITRLGERTVDSPLSDLLGTMRETVHYVTEHDRVLIDDTLGMATRRGALSADLPALNPGGPRAKLYFRPTEVTAAIVTCGGLCPGLNNVIRGLVLQLTEVYGAHAIFGFRNGYEGLTDGSDPIPAALAQLRPVHRPVFRGVPERIAWRGLPSTHVVCTDDETVHPDVERDGPARDARRRTRRRSHPVAHRAGRGDRADHRRGHTRPEPAAAGSTQADSCGIRIHRIG